MLIWKRPTPSRSLSRTARGVVAAVIVVISASSAPLVPGLAARRGGASPPGVAAPPPVVQQLQTALTHAVHRFEAGDVPGLLAHVSEQYRTGPFTKAGLREQLNAIYGVHDSVRAQVRIEDVRMVGEHAWVYSSGEVSGRLRWVGTWMVILSWQHELEVARRESGVWRLFGYQQ
jgi:hypothetical protein